MTENAVEVRSLCKSFGSVKSNQNVSLELKKGEILALLGENGSGKSTFVNMLSGIYRPDSGKILIYGNEVEFYSPEDVSKGILHCLSIDDGRLDGHTVDSTDPGAHLHRYCYGWIRKFKYIPDLL